MKVRVLQSAKEHLAEGARFYEDQEVGLGLDFLRSLLTDIGSLAHHGGVHATAFGFHRSISKRFPFAIYYLLDGKVVRVHAVLDGRRSPASIRRRPGET